MLPHSSSFFNASTMPLVEFIHTTPAIQAEARTLAPLLCESDATQIPTEDRRVKWFKYKRGESWGKEFDALLEEAKTVATDIKTIVEKHAGFTVQKSQPGEKRPLPSLERLDAGWVTIPAGYVVFLVCIAPGDCTEAAVQVRANIKDNNHSTVPGWLCGLGVVLIGRVSFRTEPAGIPYVSIAAPASPLGE
ncbi:hypothetical protein BCR34DRAFT_581109 [Clohesyomyces aquaticus]|uniref:Uncharacterized protein n=1 Tax=Clohesyomyces aquaticus TaxID=1231657 RepID=A0A1Y1Y360_9PLEO|nr:hypothetical protein BCR34DRAFT_581109 [Clohesyomyces aquaticus]